MKKILFVLIIAIILSVNVNAIEYKVGDKVKYREVIFYIINIDNDDNTLTLLKEEPLTVEEVSTYGKVGTDEQRVNNNMSRRVSDENYRKTINQSGYGGIAYLSNDICGYDDSGVFITDGCTNDYNKSDVKYVVDAWGLDKMNSKKVKEIRIPKVSEIAQLGYDWFEQDTNRFWKVTNDTSTWAYSGNYFYWVISDDDSNDYYGVLTENIRGDEELKKLFNGVVRPIAVLIIP